MRIHTCTRTHAHAHTLTHTHTHTQIGAALAGSATPQLAPDSEPLVVCRQDDPPARPRRAPTPRHRRRGAALGRCRCDGIDRSRSPPLLASPPGRHQQAAAGGRLGESCQVSGYLCQRSQYLLPARHLLAPPAGSTRSSFPCYSTSLIGGARSSSGSQRASSNKQCI